MKKIAIFTTTRGDIGILTPLINEMNISKKIKVLLFVGGSHIAPEHGNTISEINDLGFDITNTFDYLLNDDSSFSLAKSIGIAGIDLAYTFNEYSFDYVCVLGDRYERIPIVMCSILFKIPIIHLHGGEVTEGVIDEQIRHMITKASHFHFTICEEYSRNISLMGEEDKRIFNVGALAIDNIKNTILSSKKEIFREFNLNLDLPLAILTYHPTTLEFKIKPIDQIKNVFAALENFDIQVLITAPSIEVEREIILGYIQSFIKNKNNYFYTESLGSKKLYNLVAYSKFVIGNSSSGLIEVPYFRVPTINIGDRQKGRVRHESIIDTNYTIKSISNGIDKALSKEYRESIKGMNFKFGDGSTAKKITRIIEQINIDQSFLRKELSFQASNI